MGKIKLTTEIKQKSESWEVCNGHSTLLEHCFQVIMKFGIKVFVEGGEKPSVKGREPTTNSPHLRQVRNWTQSTAVEGEHSHHYAIPTPQPMQSMFNHLKWFGMIVTIFSFFSLMDCYFHASTKFISPYFDFSLACFTCT